MWVLASTRNFFHVGSQPIWLCHPHLGWAFSSLLLPHMPVLLGNAPQAHSETQITNFRYLSIKINYRACQGQKQLWLLFVTPELGFHRATKEYPIWLKFLGDAEALVYCPYGRQKGVDHYKENLVAQPPSSPAHSLQEMKEDLKLGQRASKVEL